jgi:tRNA dimethylallyltransferase
MNREPHGRRTQGSEEVDPAQRPLAVLLMGPTASGKTQVAVELVQRLALEIISVDSALIYRGMDIGTAKPDAATLAVAPHRLIDIRDPAEAYSAAEFRDDALREMASIGARGATPLLVGGSMLYFRALERGLARLPAADPALRERLAAQAADAGWPALHERLARLDPQAAARIHRNDPQRIQRALEVHALTGVSLSTWWQRSRGAAADYRFLKIVLAPAERALLHRRIALRFARMLEQGFVEEVSCLHRRGDLHPGLPAVRAVGYRQAWKYLDGELSASEWPDRALSATRQYARRQLTWLRSETDAVWIDPLSEDAPRRLLNLLKKAGVAAT